MDSIRLKTKELLTYHCGCYGNLVTIATMYVADVYRPKEPPLLNMDLIRGKMKELQSKMYSTQIHRLGLTDSDS